MTKQLIDASSIGRERQTVASIDGFAVDPNRLRTAANTADFVPAGQHYPGIRARLPEEYLEAALPTIRRVLAQIFGRHGVVSVIDASFSIVTADPATLTPAQRMPHSDAYSPDRFALLHYLSPTDPDGTAFFRHRATGFETIDEARRGAYAAALHEERGADGEAPPRYVGDDDPRFERTAVFDARYNRALIYPGFLLHSGAISSGRTLSPDPMEGRLTVTGFFSVARD